MPLQVFKIINIFKMKYTKTYTNLIWTQALATKHGRSKLSSFDSTGEGGSPEKDPQWHPEQVSATIGSTKQGKQLSFWTPSYKRWESLPLVKISKDILEEKEKEESRARKLRERMSNPWKRKQGCLNILSYTEQPTFMSMNLGKIKSSESFVTSGRLTRMLFPSLLF